MRIHHARTSRLATGIAALAAIASLVLGAVALAPAASADTAVSLAGVQPNGQAGVPQSLTVIASIPGATCGSTLPPTATIFGNANGVTNPIGTATYQSCSNANYQYTYQWVPSLATVWYLYASVNGAQSASIRSAIAQVPTTTVVAAPATVKQGQPVNVTATVTAGNGSIFSPQGTIQFAVVGGGNIGTPVPLNQSIPSTATVSWTPSTLGAVALTATYTPANSGTPNQNTTCGSSCTSAPDAVQVTTSGVNLYLSNPPSFSAGSSAILTAVVGVTPPSGTVTFTINGAVLAANVPVPANGITQTRWTPPAAGQYTIAANWTGSGGVTGSAQETVTVGPPSAQPDQIIIITAGGTTLTAGASYTTPNGTVITFTSQTASGSPVTFAVTGPCTINGGTFTANQGSGQCRITASSPGGNGYAPASGTVTTNLVPGTQTAKLAAPASGKVNVGKTLTLEKPAQGKTNAGQPIKWKITKGSGSVCALVFADNGAVKLKIKKKGYCDVKATAAAVKNQWNAFLLKRTYQGK